MWHVKKEKKLQQYKEGDEAPLIIPKYIFSGIFFVE